MFQVAKQVPRSSEIKGVELYGQSALHFTNFLATLTDERVCEKKRRVLFLFFTIVNEVGDYVV